MSTMGKIGYLSLSVLLVLASNHCTCGPAAIDSGKPNPVDAGEGFGDANQGDTDAQVPDAYTPDKYVLDSHNPDLLGVDTLASDNSVPDSHALDTHFADTGGREDVVSRLGLSHIRLTNGSGMTASDGTQLTISIGTPQPYGLATDGEYTILLGAN